MSIRYYGIPAQAGKTPEHGLIVRWMDETDQKPYALPLCGGVTDHAKGFDWGLPEINGVKSKAMTAGASQLALALCCHALANNERGLKLHQRFKLRVVSKWTLGQPWSTTAEEIAAVCDQIEADELPPQALAAIAQERAPVESETGHGVDRSMGGIKWKTREDGSVIPERDD